MEWWWWCGLGWWWMALDRFEQRSRAICCDGWVLIYISTVSEATLCSVELIAKSFHHGRRSVVTVIGCGAGM